MSARSAVNYLWNYPQLRQSGFVPRTLTVTYYVTERCNLNCVYCEDFGAKRNPRCWTGESLSGCKAGIGRYPLCYRSDHPYRG